MLACPCELPPATECAARRRRGPHRPSSCSSRGRARRGLSAAAAPSPPSCRKEAVLRHEGDPSGPFKRTERSHASGFERSNRLGPLPGRLLTSPPIWAGARSPQSRSSTSCGRVSDDLVFSCPTRPRRSPSIRELRYPTRPVSVDRPERLARPCPLSAKDLASSFDVGSSAVTTQSVQGG